MKRLRWTAIAAALIATSLTASAGDWGSWERFGDTGISIRFAQVNRTTCTWAFRNDSSRVLKTLRFRIDDTNAETGQSESSNDLIPFSLRPGQSVGGWAAFTAEAACGNVRITGTEIEWQ
jgi:hypothetical protein